MMTSAIIEKVLYLAITPDIFKAFEDSIFLSFRGLGGGGGGGGGGKKAKKLPGLSICIYHNHPNTYAMILITGSHL